MAARASVTLLVGLIGAAPGAATETSPEGPPPWLPAKAEPIAADPERAPAPRPRLVDLGTVLAADPGPLAPGRAVVGYTLGTSSASGPLRPIPVAPDFRDPVHVVTVEGAVSRRAALFATAAVAQPLPLSDVHAASGLFGLRVLLTSPSDPSLRVSVQAGALREFGGDAGGFARVTASIERGPLRLGALAHVEHLGSPGRDGVDVYAVASASYAVAAPLRIGLDYVAQDLEEGFDSDGAEGGARHYLVPNLSVQLPRDGLALGAGAAFDLAAVTPTVIGRAALSMVY